MATTTTTDLDRAARCSFAGFRASGGGASGPGDGSVHHRPGQAEQTGHRAPSPSSQGKTIYVHASLDEKRAALRKLDDRLR